MFIDILSECRAKSDLVSLRNRFESGHVTDKSTSRTRFLIPQAIPLHNCTMSTQITTQQPVVQEATRGRGGNRGRSGRKGGRGQGTLRGKPKNQTEQTSKETGTADPTATTNETTDPGEELGDDLVCWICAEPVKYWSVSDCNHRTCHVCALRLRALYKKTDCTFCKVCFGNLASYVLSHFPPCVSNNPLQEPQRTVIFTASADAEFSSYKPDDISFKDVKLSIYFETQEMMEETLILLKFNCPNDDCDYIANGWGDLKLHTRAVHGRLIWSVTPLNLYHSL
jgi:hypothetical protein